MTAVHRPLSDWVARVVRDASAQESRLGPINDGDERVDARKSPMFNGPWRRQMLDVIDDEGRSYGALGLHNPDTGLAIVELDDYGVPLAITGSGIALIASIEEAWPTPRLTERALTALRALSPEIRYFLLSRLVAEGAPDAALFHVLPWDGVEAAAEAARLRLAGVPAPEVRELRHWVTPAVLGVVGPLEQMLEGFVGEEPDLVRVGSTALCEGLRTADVARIPESTARKLAALLTQLGMVNPFLRRTAGAAAERLLGLSGRRFVVEMDSELPKAAAAEANRVHVEHLQDDSPLVVESRVTAGGRLIVTVDFAIEVDPARDQLLDIYQALFLPVTVQTDERRDRYWVALEARRRNVSGSIEVLAPRGRFTVDADRAPVGAHELRRVAAEDLAPSLAAADNAGVRIWQNLAQQLPADHPVRQAVASSLESGQSR